MRIKRIRGLPFIFRDLANIILQSTNWQLYRKAWYFWGYTYSERFNIQELFVLFTVTNKIHRARKMELNREHFSAIIFYNFRCGLTQQQCFDEHNLIFGDEAPSRTRTEVVVHSKTNFVKDVQNQLLFRKPLMLYTN